MSASLQITARLDAPVAFHVPIHFDALLAAAVARRDGLISPAHGGELVHIEVPIERAPCGRYYLASVGCCSVEAYEARYVNRRHPVEELAWIGDGRTKRVNLGAGPQKIYRIPMSTMHLRGDQITWWCQGDMGKLMELLQLVTGIGKKRAVGLGAVREWTVEPCDAWPGFPVLSERGLALRNLPIDTEGLCVGAMDVQRLDPPYWVFADRVECAIPEWGA